MVTTRVFRSATDAQIFVARQPIFDRKKNVMAYELMFRSGLDNCFGNHDGNVATSRVIVDSFFHIGMSELTEGKRAFINFSEDLLLEKVAVSLPADLCVVEVLETVRPGPEIVDACKSLKEAGFQLALDDVVQLDGWEPILPFIDIVKVDFIQSDSDRRRLLAEQLLPQKIVLLAEKVESEAAFAEGIRLGYRYFQGYFFKKPVIISSREIPVSVTRYLELLRVVNQSEFDLAELETLIRGDVALSYKLFRFVNSAAFPWGRKIESLRHMMVALGTENLKRFLSLIILSVLVSEKPAELIRTSLLRAHFCETVGLALEPTEQHNELFFMGMFSLMDAILDQSVKNTLQWLPFSDQMKDAIAGKENSLGQVLKLVKGYEEARWSEVSRRAKNLGMDEKDLPELYLQAARQAQLLMVE